MERAEEALRKRVRETPLSERLTTCEKYIASMCAERRPPKMTIPLQHYDEDFYIYTTLADAQATIAALQARLDEQIRTWWTLRGVETPCEKCSGAGWRAYASTATWRGGIGGQAITNDVCDKCWGSGDIYRKGADIRNMEAKLTQRTAEFQRHDGELQQICGQALGYPWFKDDQKNFPGATEKDGVCVGEHVGITIAQELANAYRKRTAELEAAKRDRDELQSVFDLGHTRTVEADKLWQDAHGKPEVWPDLGDLVGWLIKRHDDVQAELERVRGELVEATHNVNVYQSLYSTSCMDRALLENDLRDIRTLVLALPKGEGDWTVSCALADRVVEGGIVSDISEAVAAIVQHRQGMEG